jgi:hypothetical protein
VDGPKYDAMRFTLEGLALILFLLVAMLVAQSWGRRQGERDRLLAAPGEKNTYGASEGAVMALLGLFLAFAFSGAGNRFDDRRHLIIEETNAIGTAWLRIELLPADAQPAIRAMFREYLDARLETYQLIAEGKPDDLARDRYVALQQRIWTESVRAAHGSGETVPAMLLLPALNQMFDITTTRMGAMQIHPPMVVYGVIAFLAIVSSVFVGYGIAGNNVRSAVHSLAFSFVLVLVLYVIVDLEFPRLGLIRIDSMDELLVNLRKSMD